MRPVRPPETRKGIVSAYLIVNFQIDDADGYKGYQQGAVPALKIGDASTALAVDSDTTQLEGEGAGAKTVILKFDSYEEAKELYESAAYQEVLPARLAATSRHFALLVRGLD